MIKKTVAKQKALEGSELFQFTNVSISPDKTKMLLYAEAGLSIPSLYYASIDGTGVKELSWGSNAVWSPNSQYIAFISKPADAGPMLMVILYDTKNEKQEILSYKQKTQYENLGYSNIRWLDDNSGIKVHYEAYDDIPYGNKIGEGETIIYLSSN